MTLQEQGLAEARLKLGRSVRPIAAGSLSVLVSIVFLVVATQERTPTHDDFYTLEFARQPTVSAVLDLHARSLNSTAPPPYVMHWGWAQVAGTSFFAAATLSIIGWAILTGLLAWMLRGLRPIAVFTGALFPTLTSIAYLGSAARAYSVVLALLAAASVLCGVAGSSCRSAGRHAALACVIWFACVLHYPAALYVLFLVVAVAIGISSDRRQLTVAATMVAAVALATIPQLRFAGDARAYSGVLPAAGTRTWSGALTQLSLLRTWWPLFAVLLVSILFTWPRWWWAVTQPRRSPPSGFCVVTAVLLPPLASVPFAVVGAAFSFRYAAPVLIVTGLLVGISIDALPTTGRHLALALAPAIALSLLLSHDQIRRLTPSERKVAAMQSDLGLELLPTEPVYVTEQRTFMLLEEYGENPDRFWLCSSSNTPIASATRRCPPAHGVHYVVMTASEWRDARRKSPSTRERGTTSFTSNDRAVSVVLVELA